MFTNRPTIASIDKTNKIRQFITGGYIGKQDYSGSIREQTIHARAQASRPRIVGRKARHVGQRIPQRSSGDSRPTPADPPKRSAGKAYRRAHEARSKKRAHRLLPQALPQARAAALLITVLRHPRRRAFRFMTETFSKKPWSVHVHSMPALLHSKAYRTSPTISLDV